MARYIQHPKHVRLKSSWWLRSSWSALQLTCTFNQVLLTVDCNSWTLCNYPSSLLFLFFLSPSFFSLPPSLHPSLLSPSLLVFAMFGMLSPSWSSHDSFYCPLHVHGVGREGGQEEAVSQAYVYTEHIICYFIFLILPLIPYLHRYILPITSWWSCCLFWINCKYISTITDSGYIIIYFRSLQQKRSWRISLVQ